MKLLFAGSVSACLETDTKTPFYSEEPFSVYVNGEKVSEEKTNVFSLYNLIPETEYSVEIRNESLSDRLVFSTAAEPCAFSVKAFGAKGDGISDDTVAIQTAINVLPKGARLFFDEGVYLTRPLFLKSNMTLDISEKAVVLGSPEKSDYPVVPGEVKNLNSGEDMNFAGFEGNSMDMYQSLITAEYAENIVITGRGIIDGNAQNSVFWTDFKNDPVARPRLCFFHRCKNIILHGITGCNSPSWQMHPHYSENVSFFDVSVKAPDNSPNTDAIDPESCNGVNIIGCRLSVGDDCIAIKSGKIEMGKRFASPAAAHVIRNCLMERGHGAVTLGSETASGVKELEVSQCMFLETDRGLRIKTRRGRGKLCEIDGITFSDIYMDGVLTPFVINMWYNCCDPDRYSEYNTTRECLPVDERTPHLGRFAFRNIKCVNSEAAACYIDGLPEKYIDEVVFENVEIGFKEDARPSKPAMMNNGITVARMGLYFDNVGKVVVRNVKLSNVDGPEVITKNVGEYIKE